MRRRYSSAALLGFLAAGMVFCVGAAVAPAAYNNRESLITLLAILPLAACAVAFVKNMLLRRHLPKQARAPRLLSTRYEPKFNDLVSALQGKMGVGWLTRERIIIWPAD